MKKVAIFLLLLMTISLVSAHTSVNYYLIGDKAFVKINFGEVSNFEFKLPYDSRTIESNADHKVIEDILEVDYSNNLEISYITESVIDKSKNRNYFILNNDFKDPVSLVLYLSEGDILDDLVFPDPDSITSDGKNIILSWHNFSGEEIVVAYKDVSSTNFWGYFLLLLILFFIFYVYQAKKFKRKLIKIKAKKQRTKDSRKKDVVRNLVREEKKIIEYLFDKKGHSCWTKELVRDIGISKVRLSRKLRNLVQKKLIKKVPYGNENKIKLLKIH